MNHNICRQKKGVKKIVFVSSSGGHLMQLYHLRPFWAGKDRVWVTFDKPDAVSLLEGERLIPCAYPSNRSLKVFLKNLKLAQQVIKTEKPDVIISSGAAVAVPFFMIGKLAGVKLVFLEVYDRFDKLSLTGRIVYPLADLFFVQWKNMKDKYKKSTFVGSLY